MKKVISSIKRAIYANKPIFNLIYPIYSLPYKWRIYKKYSKALDARGDKKVYYLGMAVHPNLGDLAQSVCIMEWINKNLSDYTVVEIETNALVNTPFSVLKKLKKHFDVKKDVIIFQSGYTTTDLGGYADVMHQAVIKALPEAKMLMMPQTIFFKDKKRQELCGKVYSTAHNMLYLARDRVSFEAAKSMFKNIKTELYPDIVTTLIGKYSFNYERDGIALCVRDDGEKYYSEAEIAELTDRLKKRRNVFISDTTKKSQSGVVENAESYIKKEIDTFAHYKVTITDRYHGTILSLAAGTPVVIIKTTDHKVVTGAEWFKGVYDGYVYVADDLDEAYKYAQYIYEKALDNRLSPYFEEAYYDKLCKLAGIGGNK